MKIFRILLGISNLICIILAISILIFNFHYWHEYLGGGLTILITIFGIIVSGFYSDYQHIIFIFYAIFILIDIAIMIANIIVTAIHLNGYSKHCYEYNNEAIPPPGGCTDWEHEGWLQGVHGKIFGIFFCLSFSVILRVASGIFIVIIYIREKY